MSAADEDHIIHLGEARVDPELLEIRTNGRVNRVTRRDMDVLLELVRADGRLVSRERLLETVWTDVVVNDEAVSLSISRLRRALGESAADPKFIQTVPTRGYRIEIPDPKRRLRFGRRSVSVAVILLTALLVAMTLMFVRVRSEYVQVSESETEQVNSPDSR